MLHSNTRSTETINESLEKIIGRVDGLYGIVISDSQGAVYSRVMRQDSPSHLPLFPVQFAIPDPANPRETVHVPATDPGSVLFASSASTGGRMGLGQVRTITSIYGDHLIVQTRHFPLIITFVAAVGANRALLYNIIPELHLKLERLRIAVDGDIKESEVDVDDH